MGLAASQCNFGMLTDRKLTIGFELQRLAGTKEALTRDMQRVSREYRDALSSKTLKWSGNCGVTYTDLSYSTLMKPGATTDNTPVLVTNSSGNVVLDEQYAEYAKMLDGKKYEGETRYNILSGLVGIPVATLQQYDSTSADIETKKTAITDAETARDAVPHAYWDTDVFINKLLSLSSWGYKKSDILNPTSAADLSSKIQGALCGKGYFSATVENNIKTACTNAAGSVRTENTDTYKAPTAEDFVSTIVNNIKGNSDKIKVMLNVNDNNKGTQAEYEAADAVCKQAEADYQAAVSANAQVIDSPTKKKIEYYDKLFTAIAEMGWEEDKGIGDSEYLGQMFMNNCYYVTKMTKNNSYDSSLDIDERNYLYNYDTEAAENYNNIFKVNDSDAHEAALVKYEYEKNLINEKEKRIDTRMKNLETEESAIKQMLESIDKTKNQNIDRTFGLWA